MVRTKARWIEDGEKPSKYFCNLEKRRHVNKTITKLTVDDGSIIQSQEGILNEVLNFYKQLYSSRDDSIENIDLNVKLDNESIPKLSEDEQNKCDADITLSQATNFLRKMKNDKSPGPDGFTVEFFKCFWKDLEMFFIRSWNEGFRWNELSLTQRQGIISIIPKANKPRDFLKNWRPISLLNVSYKILSGLLAERLKSVLPKLIHKDQRGFMQGRFIAENTRIIYDVLQITKEKRIPGMMLLVDFEKSLWFYSLEIHVKHSDIFLVLGITFVDGLNFCIENPNYVLYKMEYSQNSLKLGEVVGKVIQYPHTFSINVWRF